MTTLQLGQVIKKTARWLFNLNENYVERTFEACLIKLILLHTVIFQSLMDKLVANDGFAIGES